MTSSFLFLLRSTAAPFAAVALSFSAHAAVIDFQDLSLPANSFYNGSDGAGKFLSGGATFANTYTDFGGGFTSWDGFAYANKTDKTTAGFANQYSAFPGGGSSSSGSVVAGGIYAVAYDGATLTLPAGQSTPLSLRVTNTTYAALSMRDGDSFAKKFGGASGNDPDFLKLTITGLGAGDVPTGTVDFFLADFRFSLNSDDYLVGDWRNVSLTSLGTGVVKLKFSLSSSDNGQFGMNTPSYFALDYLQVVPEPGAPLCLALGAFGVALRRRRTLSR